MEGCGGLHCGEAAARRVLQGPNFRGVRAFYSSVRVCGVCFLLPASPCLQLCHPFLCPLPPRSCTPTYMRDLHTNYTSTVRDWLEIDTELGRLGVDTMEEGLVKQGHPPFKEEDLAVMRETTTTYVQKN